MIKASIAVFAVALLAGCAGPRYAGTAISPTVLSSKPQVVVVQDAATREGFKETVEGWLKDEGYSFIVVPENTRHDHDKLTIEYVGKWSWDLALYLREAKIEGFHEGQRVGAVEFRSPNSLNFDKWGSGEGRIKYMLDVLFGKITVAEATKNVN